MTGSKYNNIKSSVQKQNPDKTIEGFTFFFVWRCHGRCRWDRRTISREQYQGGRTKKAGACSEDHDSWFGQLQSLSLSICLSVILSCFISLFQTLRHCWQGLPEWSRYGHGVAFSMYISLLADVGMALAGPTARCTLVMCGI